MNLDRLEELARAAIRGKWDERYVQGAVRHIARNVDYEMFIEDPEDVEFSWDRYKDGPYIAAACPDVVLKLIAVARAASALALYEEASWETLYAALAALEAATENTNNG